MAQHHLLCIVSQQHVPNLLAILHFKPDHVHLLLTGAMRLTGEHETLSSALRRAGWSPDGRISVVRIEREDYSGEAADRIERLVQKFPDDRWTVMTTGGTKPLSAAAYAAFAGNRCARSIYMSVDQPDLFVDQRTGEFEPCARRLDVGEFLACSGARIVSEVAPPGISQLDGALKRVFNIQLRKQRADLFKKTGDWLEIFCYSVLNAFSRDLTISDVLLGVKFEIPCENPETGMTEVVENDFDVVCMWRNRLYWMECKTGHDMKDAADFLYEVAAKTAMLKSLGARPALMALREDLGNPQQLARAGHFGLTVFHENDLEALALSLQSKSALGARDVLKRWLR